MIEQIRSSAFEPVLAAAARLRRSRSIRRSRPTRRSAASRARSTSVGSDTMNNLMTLWAEAFQKLYPNVKIQIEGKGSSTAPPALIAGTAQLGPMSRAMKPTEIDEFEKKYGYKPTAAADRRTTPWPSTSTRTTRSRS